MNLSSATAAISNAFVAQFSGTYPIDLENEVFDPPAGGAPWLRLRVVERDQRQSTHGRPAARKWQSECSARVDVYTPPEGTGSSGSGGATPVLDLAELVRAFFRGKSISGAKFRGATVSTPTSDSEGRWVQRIVDAQFYFQETA